MRPAAILTLSLILCIGCKKEDSVDYPVIGPGTHLVQIKISGPDSLQGALVNLQSSAEHADLGGLRSLPFDTTFSVEGPALITVGAQEDLIRLPNGKFIRHSTQGYLPSDYRSAELRSEIWVDGKLYSYQDHSNIDAVAGLPAETRQVVFRTAGRRSFS